MSQRTPMKQHAIDAANGSFATSIVAATLFGMTLQDWAAIAALTYSCLLILDKLGLLALLKSGAVRSATWLWVKVVHRGS